VPDHFQNDWSAKIEFQYFQVGAWGGWGRAQRAPSGRNFRGLAALDPGHPWFGAGELGSAEFCRPDPSLRLTARRLRPPAQGCRAAATLGVEPETASNANGVPALPVGKIHGSADATPLGLNGPLCGGSQGSCATLGWRPQPPWGSSSIGQKRGRTWRVQFAAVKPNWFSPVSIPRLGLGKASRWRPALSTTLPPRRGSQKSAQRHSVAATAAERRPGYGIETTW